MDVGVIADEDIATSVGAGAAYVHPHLDVEGRAVIVVEIAKHNLKERDLAGGRRDGGVWGGCARPHARTSRVFIFLTQAASRRSVFFHASRLQLFVLSN